MLAALSFLNSRNYFDYLPYFYGQYLLDGDIRTELYHKFTEIT